MGEPDQIQIQAEGWNHFIERQIRLRWPAPLRGWFPDGDSASYMLHWHWLFFQFVFPIDDPRDFPTLPADAWTDDERSVLDRYLQHAAELAKATALSAESGYTVSISDPESDWRIEEANTVAKDATIGFLTMFRQCYSPDEAASFKRVHDLVRREAHRAGLPSETMRAWKGDNNRMRGAHLDYVILKRAAEAGLIRRDVAENSGSNPDRVARSPQELLSAILYGEAIHWGSHRAVVESWNNDHFFWSMNRRFDAVRIAVQLGHLYVGFAALVGRATGALSFDRI